MSSGPVRGVDLRSLAAIPLGVATIVVLVALAIVLFLNPLWLGAAQDRADAVGWTGWPRETVAAVTDGLLHDLVLGPPDFAMAVDGQLVFDERERAHMRDVRAVFELLFLAALAGVAILIVARRMTRGSPRFWRVVLRASGLVVLVVALLGVLFGVAFDAAFEVFHQLFFPAGSYAFDPATARLVQLLPGRLWYETSLAFGALLVILASALAAVAYRRSR